MRQRRDMSIQKNAMKQYRHLCVNWKKMKSIRCLLYTSIGTYVDTSGIKEALRTKNKEVIFDVLSKLILNIKNKYFLEESELYSHMSFSETASENLGLMLEKCFDDDKELDLSLIHI